MPDDSVRERSLVSGLHRAVRDHLTAAQSEEGLRERKKRMMRQHISDTATTMFLDRGFDEVRVSEVAEACGVSEKTVFNYFPTKESLLLDREDDMAADIREALGPTAGRVSPVDAAVAVLGRNAVDFTAIVAAPGASGMGGVRRFTELIERTPSLRAAQIDMMERLAQVAAEAMAARAGVNPDDPEPQIAASALLGLWRIYWRALNRYSEAAGSPAEVRDLVIDEVQRAARLIDTGLWSFGLVVQGVNGRQQQQTAAAASNEARKQVMLAIRQAREAWRLIKAEAQELTDAGETNPHRAAQQVKRDAPRAAQQAKREAHRRRMEDRSAGRTRDR